MVNYETYINQRWKFRILLPYFEYLVETFTHKYPYIRELPLYGIQIRCKALGKYAWYYNKKNQEET